MAIQLSLLLRYQFAPHYDTERNQASAGLASYDEVLDLIRKMVVSKYGDEYRLPPLPATGSTIVYRDTNMADWRGLVLSWGPEPTVAMDQLDINGEMSLIIDGNHYDPIDNSDPVGG